MKTRAAILFFAGVLLAVGCTQKPKEFATRTVKGERCWQLIIDDSTNTWVRNRYELQWPQMGCISSSTERELVKQVFGSCADKSLHRSCENFLNSQGMMEEVDGVRYPAYNVDAIPDTVMFTEQEISTVCEANEKFITLTVTSYIFPEGAAHGTYDISPIVIERGGGIVQLADIVDTNQLGPIVARAVNKLPANSDVRECLFDEFRDTASFPVSQVFSISNTMDTVYLVYGLYWLTPYACGIQNVALPVSMLNETMALTERGKKIFGL